MALTSTGWAVIRPVVGCRRRDLRPTDDYWKNWQEFRVLRWRALLMTIVAPVVFFTLPEVLPPVRQWLERIGVPEIVLATLGPLSFMFFVVRPWAIHAIAKPSAWPCPRCRLSFGSHVSSPMPLWYVVQLCAHCGLPKWAPRDPAPKESKVLCYFRVATRDAADRLVELLTARGFEELTVAPPQGDVAAWAVEGRLDVPFEQSGHVVPHDMAAGLARQVDGEYRGWCPANLQRAASIE